MKRILLIMISVLFSANIFAAGLSATFDRDTIARGETVNLDISASDKLMGNPDLSSVKKYFQVLGSSRSSAVTAVNNKLTMVTQWHFQLLPKVSGKITIPAIYLGKAISAPLQLTITKAAADLTSLAQQKSSLMQGFISSQPPYVQQQILYHYKLTLDKSLADTIQNERFQLPTIQHATVQPLGQPKNYLASHHGKTQVVYSGTLAIFPQQSGKLIINSPVFIAQKVVPQIQGRQAFYDPFGGGMSLQPLSVSATPTTINVLPQPATATASNWLPASNVSLRQQWVSLPQAIHAGEPITRRITIRAAGVLPDQIPDLTIHPLSHIKVYQQKPQENNSITRQGFVSKKVIDLVYMPSQAGNIRLPAIKLSWWNSQIQQPVQAQVPAKHFHILPAETTTAMKRLPKVVLKSPSKSMSTKSASNRDLWALVIGLLLLWLVTVIAWWLSKYHKRKQPRLKPQQNPIKQIKAACQHQDKVALKNALLQWSETHSLPAISEKNS